MFLDGDTCIYNLAYDKVILYVYFLKAVITFQIYCLKPFFHFGHFGRANAWAVRCL